MTLSRTEPDNFGNPPFTVWREAHPEIGFATLADAAGDADLVVNADHGEGSIPALEAADNLAAHHGGCATNFLHNISPDIKVPAADRGVSAPQPRPRYRTPATSGVPANCHKVSDLRLKG